MRIVKGIFGGLLLGLLFAIMAYVLGFLSNLFKSIDVAFQTQSYKGPPLDIESTCLGLADWEHLKWALLIVGIIFLFALILIIKGRLENLRSDPRNFTVSKKGTYGTAKSLSQRKAKKLLTADGEHELLTVRSELRTEDTGIILGTFPNGKIVLKNAINKENMNVLVVGAPGSGKSYMFVRPYLAQCIRRGESFICTDPSGELLESMGGYARDCGYKVKVFNLVDPSKSDSWNITADIKTDQLLVQIAVTTIIRNTLEGEKGDPFWDNGEKNLLKSLLLYVNSNVYTGVKSIGAMYNLLASDEFKNTLSNIANLDENHPAKQPYNIYAQATEQVQTAFASGLATRLQIFQSDEIRKMTGHNDIDLTAPGKERCAYFVIMSDQDSTYQLLSSLFFSFLFIKLADFGKTCENQSLPVKVNVVLDELPSIGIIPDLGRKLATVRKYGINVVPIIQLISQLDNRYSLAEREEIIGCCDTQLWLGSNDMSSAEILSERSGTMTVDVSSKSEEVDVMDTGLRLTSSVGKRPYLTIDEVIRMPLNEAVVVLRGQNVLRLKKFKFHKHPDFKKVKKSEKIRLSQYEPEYKRNLKEAPPSTETSEAPESQQPPVAKPKVPKPEAAKSGQPKQPYNPKPQNAPKKSNKNPSSSNSDGGENAKPEDKDKKGKNQTGTKKNQPKQRTYAKPPEKKPEKPPTSPEKKELLKPTKAAPAVPRPRVNLSKDAPSPSPDAVRPPNPVPKPPKTPQPPVIPQPPAAVQTEPSPFPPEEKTKGGMKKGKGLNIKVH